MGLFANIKNAKFSAGGVYIQPGVYRLEINAVKTMTTRTNKQAFLVEFKVLESTNTAHQVGSEVTWMVTFDKEPAMGNVKQFLATALHDLLKGAGHTGDYMDQIDESVAEGACSDKQPLKGIIVRCAANNIKTKAGRDFTKVKFIPDVEGASAANAVHAAG